MATGLTILNRAMRLLGQLESGVSATTEEQADGLIALNAMLDSWRNERLMAYAIRDQSVTMVASQEDYLIGPSGSPTPDLITERPVAIESAYIVVSGASYPVRMLDELEYAAIVTKLTGGDWPQYAYYRPTMPAGTILVYPVPNGTSVLHILTRTPLTVFATIGETVVLPPGWEEAMATNLAIAIAPEFETEPRPSVIKMAQESKANIKRINSRPIKAHTELVALVGHHSGNILAG